MAIAGLRRLSFVLSTLTRPVCCRKRFQLRGSPHRLAEKTLTSKSALEGEPKQVTVLFADLNGSTEPLGFRAAGQKRAYDLDLYFVTVGTHW